MISRARLRLENRLGLKEGYGDCGEVLVIIGGGV